MANPSGNSWANFERPRGVEWKSLLRMEFDILKNSPAPEVATRLDQRYVLDRLTIRDDQGHVLGQITVDTFGNNGSAVRVWTLWQNGQVTAEFRWRPERDGPAEFVYAGQTMKIHPDNYYLCEEIQARTEMPWFPPGRCTFRVDDSVDPVSALFLFQRVESLEEDPITDRPETGN